MFKSKYTIQSKAIENSVTEGSKITIKGSGKIQLRLHKDIAPNKRGDVKKRIDNLFFSGLINYLISCEGYVANNSNYTLSKRHDNSQVSQIRPSKTLLTKIGIGVGVDLHISSDSNLPLSNLINTKKIHDYILTGEGGKWRYDVNGEKK